MKLPKLIEPYFFKKTDLYPVSKYILGVAERVRAQELDARQKKKVVVMISGLSGAGKDSVVDELIKKRSDMVRVKTLTTRERRVGEAGDNDPYERVTVGQFEDYLKKGKIMEYTEYTGNFYGTEKRTLEEMLLGDKIPILRVDPKGADFYLQKWMSGDLIFKEATLIYIFVIPPSLTALQERLLIRSGDADFVKKRMEQSQNDITHIGEAEYIAINESGKLREVVEQVSLLI